MILFQQEVLSGDIYRDGVILEDYTEGSNIDITSNVVSVISAPSFSGIVNITNTTEATTKTTGSLIVSGGLGVSKDLYANNIYSNGVQLLNATAGTNISIAGSAVSVVSNPSFSGVVNITNTTDSSSISTGSLIVSGGLGISKKLYVGGGIYSINPLGVIYNFDDYNNMSFGGTIESISDNWHLKSSTGNQLFQIQNSLNGRAIFASSLESTTTTTGALVVNGGLGIVKNINAGGIMSITNTTESTTVGTGAVVVSGGLGITKNATVGGITTITNTTESTTVGTGAVVISGGIGITKNTSIGGISTYTSVGLGAPTFTTRSTGSRIVFVNALSGSAVDIGLGYESNFMWSSVASSSFGFKWYAGTTNVMSLSGTGILTLPTAPATLTDYSQILLRDSANGIIKTTNLTTPTFSGITSITNTTESTTTGTGAVVISGGLGITKNVNIGGTTTVSNTTESTSSSNGAAVISGGVGIAKNLYCNQRIFRPNNYAFMASLSANQVPTGIANYKILFNNVSGGGCYEKGGSNYDTTNSKWICPVAGLYYFSAAVIMTTSATQEASIMRITSSNVNNSSRTATRDDKHSLGIKQVSIGANVTLNCAVNKEISIFLEHTVNYPSLLSGSGTLCSSFQYTHFSGHFIG